MKKFLKNEEASVIPIFLFILLGGLVSFIALILGEILEPFINLLADGAFKSFLSFAFPYGFMLGCFFTLTFALYLRMQKSKYEQGGYY